MLRLRRTSERAHQFRALPPLPSGTGRSAYVRVGFMAPGETRLHLVGNEHGDCGGGGSARRRGCLRACVIAAVALLFACGGKNPAGPDGASSIVQLGPQVLRISPRFTCTQLTPGVLALVLTRVTVTQSGSGWVASAKGGDAGDVRLQFQESDNAGVTGAFQVTGSVTGAAVHVPDLLSTVPAWQLRATFGGGATVSGFAFAAGSLGSPVAGLDGVGSGPITFTDAANNTCSGSGFSWSIGATF